MKEAQLPKNEEERLALLRGMNILDTPIEERFERITRIVCRSLNVPISAISLVDQNRQWFKSIQGLNVSETPRSIAFCSHAILQEDPLIIGDATQDERFYDNPLVVNDPAIRFYAGIPLSVGNNIKIGTLCAIDQKPREITQEEIYILEDLKIIVESELKSIVLSKAYIQLISELKQAERAALIDSLTRLWNRLGGETLLQRQWEYAQVEGNPIAVVMVDIDHFKNINDTYGHQFGDTIITHAAQIILSSLRSVDLAIRWGGDEFLLVIDNCQKEDVFNILSRLKNLINKTPVRTSLGNVSITFSMGACVSYPSDDNKTEDFIRAADEALYKAKKAGRNQFVIVESCVS